MKTASMPVGLRNYASMGKNNRNPRIVVCSPYSQHRFIRDEVDVDRFTLKSVESYFSEGMLLLREHLMSLEDLSSEYSVADEHKLSFMIESLVYARRLLEEQL